MSFLLCEGEKKKKGKEGKEEEEKEGERSYQVCKLDTMKFFVVVIILLSE